MNKAYTGEIDFNVTNVPSYNEYSVLPDYSYLEQYESITYRAIKVIADALVTYDYELFDIKGEQPQKIQRKTNQLLKDLTRFNSFQSLSEARRLTFTYKRLTGNAYWLIKSAEEKGYLFEFYILDPTRISVNAGSNGIPKKYIYTDRTGKRVNFDPEDIIVFQETSPKSMLKGTSIIDASRYAHFNHEMIRKAQLNQFGNLSAKGILVYGNQEPGSMKLDGKKKRANMVRLREWFRNKYSGIRNWGKVPVVSTDVKWVQIGQTNKELDFQNSVNDIRDEILAIHGVPRPMVGFPDSTYSNAKEMIRVFQMNTLRPELNSEEEVLNEQLLPKYYGDTKMQLADSIRFIIEDPVEPDKSDLMESMYNAWVTGAIDRKTYLDFLGVDTTEKDEGVYYVAPGTQNYDVIEEDIKKLGKTIASLPEVKRQKEVEDERNKMKEFYYQKNLTQEEGYEKAMRAYWVDQSGRVTKSIIGKKSALITTKNLNEDEEIVAAVEALGPEYMRQARTWEQIANEIIDSAESLTEENYDDIFKYIERFAKKFNEDTKSDLTRVIANAVKEGLTETETAEQIAKLYSAYMDGQGNIDTLTKYGVYQEAVELTEEGTTIMSSGNRYNSMLETITNEKKRTQLGLSPLTKEQQRECLNALWSVCDPSDAIGAQTKKRMEEEHKQLLEMLYHVEPTDPDIKTARLERVARTETNRIKNAVNRMLYGQSEVVEKMEWLTAHDDDVRDKHRSADGKEVPKGAKFFVGGEWLAYPGDPSGQADNTINCRCTLLPIVR